MRKILALATVLALALSTVAAVSTNASGVDPGGWQYNATTRHMYGLTGPMTWLDAEDLAVRLGGHLVTIDSQAEQDWLRAQFPDPAQWIGMNDRAREGSWVWSSRTRVTFTAWQDTQPDDWKGFDPLGEDAAVLFLADQPDGWVSISGRWFCRGIVEVPGKPKSLANDTPITGTHDGTTSGEAVADDCYANGWAFDADSPRRDVTVRILAQRTEFTQVPIEVWRGSASEFREDLLAAGFGNGTSGFTVDLRPLIAYGVHYSILVQGSDVQTGEWFTLNSSPASADLLPTLTVRDDPGLLPLHAVGARVVASPETLPDGDPHCIGCYRRGRARPPDCRRSSPTCSSIRSR